MKKKWLKRILWAFSIVFIFMNVVALFHSYKFTHFSSNNSTKTKNPKKISTGERINILIFGINNPRPKNKLTPGTDFQTLRLKSNKEIECWSIRTANSKGTVILFHGFSGEKSSMLKKAKLFQNLGYSTLLVDFMGSGGSEGNQTTIGFFEAIQVKTCFDYLIEKEEKNIYLFGTSMGAVAIMKAIHDYDISPKGIIIECPFGTMYQTVSARFDNMNVPHFPMADLLVFWGGVQNGFWAFGHNPIEYAKKIKCPSLLLYGELDKKVSLQEINDIYQNIKGEKKLIIYPDVGHEDYLIQHELNWTNNVSVFLEYGITK